MAGQHPSALARRFHPGARDLWLQRIRRATVATAAGAAGAAAVLVGVAAHETPAHHRASQSAGTSSGTSSGASSAGSTSTSQRQAPTSTSGSLVTPGTAAPHVATGQS